MKFTFTFSFSDKEWDDELFIGFALFNAFWATLYLEHWKRKSCELAYHWGTLDSQREMLKDPRPLYTVGLHGYQTRLPPNVYCEIFVNVYIELHSKFPSFKVQIKYVPCLVISCETLE